jgi:hypothetical protein
MPPNPPNFPFTHVVAKTDWNNYHGTIAGRSVPVYATLDPAPPPSQGQALKAILQYCFNANPAERVCAVGSTWSLSDIIMPANVVIDAGAMNAITRVNAAWLTPAYQAKAQPVGKVPMVVGGGTTINYLNQILGEAGLALQTSGAADGQRIAGLIATGTHGSAVQVGAVHDTVLALYLLVAPDKGLLVQPATGTPFTADLAKWFESQSGFPTDNLVDDDAFNTALVGLGSVGFVHSVVVEAVPLYRLRGRMLARPLGDASVYDAVQSMDTSPLHPDVADDPYHFSLLVNPYADAGSPGFFVGFYWKVSVDGAPFVGPSIATPMIPSDMGSLLGGFIGHVDGTLAGPIVDQVITSILSQQNQPGDMDPVFPGQAFGPTTLPPGNGLSTEIVVDQARAVDAIKTVLSALQSERDNGRHLLGAMGVRFVPATTALLGMNVHTMNCYMELGSLADPAVPQVHRACWAALDAAGIPYTCHWGQQHMLDPARLQAYFGDRFTRWQAARAKLLSAPNAQAVFQTHLLPT